MRRVFEAMVRAHQPRADLGVSRDDSLVARFREHDAPFALRATVVSTVGERGDVGEVQMAMQTSIPRSMPLLLPKHELYPWQ